jgi:hypothetical protein
MRLTEYLEGCREDLKTLGIHLQDLSLQSEEALKNIAGKYKHFGNNLSCFTASSSALWFNFSIFLESHSAHCPNVRF